jgi:hypothetical protein
MVAKHLRRATDKHFRQGPKVHKQVVETLDEQKGYPPVPEDVFGLSP